jgi:hypothetical protein
MNDCLKLVFDYNPPDQATLIVGRQKPDKTFDVISEIFGDSAKRLYTELTCCMFKEAAEQGGNDEINKM